MKPYNNPALEKKFDEIAQTQQPSVEVTKAINKLNKHAPAKIKLPHNILPVAHKDFKNMEFEEPSWLVDQLISKGGINAISGQPESHKSFIALEIIKALSLGVPFLDKFPTEQCKTLIIDEENSPGRLNMRLNTLTDQDLNLEIVSGKHIKIDELGMAEDIIKYCEANGIGLLVLDSLSSLHSADESSNTQMAAVFEHLMKIAQAGITIIFIHHEPKSARKEPGNASLRGAGDILAKCDTHTSMRHPADDVNTIVVTQKKNRDAERLPEFKIAVHREQDRTRFEHIGQVPVQVGLGQRTDEAIIALLTTSGELFQGEIIDKLIGIIGIGGKKKISACLDALTKTQLKVRVAEHGRKNYSIKQEQSNE
jgi:hypothetical protein